MAVRPATRPATTKDRITDGPASGTAEVSTMKMPVPTVAPMPNSDSWNRPIVRASSPSPVSVPVSSVMTVTGLRRQICCHSDGDAPSCSEAISPPRPLGERTISKAPGPWQPFAAPTAVPAFGVSTVGHPPARAGGCGHAQGHLRDPRVLPHQRDADLLRVADRVQPARHRPLAAQLLLRQLLRLVRGQPPARVRARRAPIPRVRVDGGRLQLPARAQGGARPHPEPRR